MFSCSVFEQDHDHYESVCVCACQVGRVNTSVRSTISSNESSVFSATISTVKEGASKAQNRLCEPPVVPLSQRGGKRRKI